MSARVQAVRSALGWPLVVAVLAITLLVVTLNGTARAPQAQATDFATLTGAVTTAAQAPAGTNDYFLKIDGIPGESTDARHKDELDVDSWTWGVANAGKAIDPIARKAAFADLTFTLRTTKATPVLMLNSAQGKHLKQAVLTVRKAGASPFEYLRITISDVIVTGLHTAAAAAAPADQLSLNYAKIVVEYIPQKADGTAGEAIRAGWDLRRNAPA